MTARFRLGPVQRFASAAIALALGAAPPAQAETELEIAVKAAFLVRFSLYVEWPPAAFAAATSPIVVCVVGEDPFGDILDKAAAAQRVNEHPLLVRRLKTATRDAGCHIAYLAGTETQRPAAMSEALRGSPVLTVSDGARGPGPAAVVVNFVIQDNRVRFEIDDASAARNGLVISSRLLGLALAVKPRQS